mmetsp:Transcript_37256/g.80517  ORF Transcript_37256/g.80517 Transcript_37256/m.80517 type:complete len:255 (-) Transcript_37256:105-869(-)
MEALALAPGKRTSLARTARSLPPSAPKQKRPRAASASASRIVVCPARSAHARRASAGKAARPLASPPPWRFFLPSTSGCWSARATEPEATEAKHTAVPPTSVESTGVAQETRSTAAEATWHPFSTAEWTASVAAQLETKGSALSLAFLGETDTASDTVSTNPPGLRSSAECVHSSSAPVFSFFFPERFPPGFPSRSLDHHQPMLRSVRNPLPQAPPKKAIQSLSGNSVHLLPPGASGLVIIASPSSSVAGMRTR